VNLRVLIRVIFLMCFMSYPFIVYFGIKTLPPSFFGLVLIALLALRFGVLIKADRPVLLPVLLILMGYAVATAVSGNTQMLLFYPALVNFCLCAVFANSLRQEESLLLRIARARGVPIVDHLPLYLYRLTALWAVFFAINGMVAVWTITVSMEVWTLYNGLISYFIVGALIGGELLFRYYYRKRMGLDN
jgi:uncharacterized membrane protein